MKTVLVLSLSMTFFAITSISAQVFERAYQNTIWKCISGDCENGQGEITDNSFQQHKISGTFINGVLNGKTTWIYKTSFPVKDFVFEGEFLNGARTIGKWSDNNGNSYNGEWKNGMRHGEGIYITNSTLERGTFESNELISGTLEEKNGRKMTITKAENGEISGTIIYQNNDFYQGVIRNKMKEGKGMLKSTNMEVYDGNWKYDNKHGEGTQIWPNGDLYDGQWSRSLRSGFGTMTWAKDSTKYIGNWLLDKPDGKGKFIYKKFSTAVIDSGYFHKGIKISQDLATYETFKEGIRQKREEDLSYFKKARADYNAFLSEAFKVETFTENCVTYAISKTAMNFFGSVSTDSYLILYQVNDKTNEATTEEIEKLAEKDFLLRGTSSSNYVQKIVNRGCSCQSIVKGIKENYPVLKTLEYEINYTLPIENK